MKSCAFLTMDSLGGYVCYDEMLIEPFQNIGWSVESVSWRDTSANWNAFNTVIIRSPWDYHDDPEAFLSVLETIDASSAVLENPLETVKWNLHKSYLLDLDKRGVPIVPTILFEGFTISGLEDAFGKFKTDEIVIKPAVSATAKDTFRITSKELRKNLETLENLYYERDLLIQPFMQSIVDEGEFSLFYFGGNLSHTILKTPQTDSFFVQEEHGGILTSADPEAELVTAGRNVFRSITPSPLYARVDLVGTTNGFAVMELELIEPSLYFNMDTDSPKRFADAFERRMKSLDI